MSELKNTRFKDQEPDFGDPDYEGVDSYKDLDESTAGIDSIDKEFDRANPAEAKRLEEETKKNGEDPTGKNYPIRRNGGKTY